MIAFENDGGSGTPSLPQAFMRAMLRDDSGYMNGTGTYLADTEEYEALDRWHIGGGSRDTSGLTHYSDYTVAQRPDGSDLSLVRFVKELYDHTDLFESMLNGTEYSYGGGEENVEPRFGDFMSSGERTVTEHGKLTEYDAHPYLGGFGYMGQDESFIIYRDGKLELHDRRMDYDNQNCIWDDGQVEETICALSDTAATAGLRQIKEFTCDSVRKIVLPVMCHTIDENAFQECASLQELHILRKNMKLGEQFAAASVHLFAPAGGTVEQYARENGNPFTAISPDSYPDCYKTGAHTVTVGGHYQITLPEECNLTLSAPDRWILNGVNDKYKEGTEENSGLFMDVLLQLYTGNHKKDAFAAVLCEHFRDDLSTAGNVFVLQEEERCSAAMLIGRKASIFGVHADMAILVIKERDSLPLVLTVVEATRDQAQINAAGFRLYKLAREIRLLPDACPMDFSSYIITDLKVVDEMIRNRSRPKRRRAAISQPQSMAPTMHRRSWCCGDSVMRCSANRCRAEPSSGCTTRSVPPWQNDCTTRSISMPRFIMCWIDESRI